jgi:nucleoside-diphosphate-sugar epimerase
MKSRILITGASGFIGSGLVKQLLREERYQIRLVLREKTMPHNVSNFCECIHIDGIHGATKWNDTLDGVDIIIHLAGRAHILKDLADNPLQQFREVNLWGTKNLANAAAKKGVRRFVYVSSVGVNGFETKFGKPFVETDYPQPHNAYAVSKMEGERALLDEATASGMEFVIIRPPLVYGYGAPGNFAQLLKLVRSRVPIPLGAVDNLRSFIALDNLIDFIIACCSKPSAANQLFLISDGYDMSTPEFVRAIAHSIERKAQLVTVPLFFLRACAMLTGQQPVVQRLCGNLQLDISKANKLLEWAPKVSVDEGMRRATLGGLQS